MKRVPKFIANQYVGGASGFRQNKRACLREARKAMAELRDGCAYFPCGSGPVDLVIGWLDEIAHSISSRNWGR